jgi:hypothetical protein
LDHYSPGRYRETLTAIYKKVCCAAVTHRIDKERLFYRFLDPDRFSLLKWGDYIE